MSDTALFCPSCGSRRAEPVCDACGAELDRDARFCSRCGVPVGQGRSGSAIAVDMPVAERRWASVLFADLVGFTTLSESRDPEQVRELLSRYFARCRSVVAEYDGCGGEVHRRGGDGGVGSPHGP